jgi:hypothetical protein
MGRLITGNMGFGWLLVSGRNLVPCPPAIITAFMMNFPPVIGYQVM